VRDVCGGVAYLPMINVLANSARLTEKMVEDLGECIEDAKNRLGYDKMVPTGWSSGGSLSVFYQRQTQHPTITANHYYLGPDQRGTQRQAVGVCTDWLHPHGFSLEQS
jgi:hypothetical protein